MSQIHAANQFELSVARVFDGDQFLTNQTVSIENGVIQSIRATGSDVKTSGLSSGLLVAGFIDLQVNGGGDKLFNYSPTVETLQTIAKAHQRFGTTSWLPTLVSDSLQVMQQASDSVALARTIKSNGIIGIHFEGPHLAAPKKGVHAVNHLRPLSADELAIYTRQDLGQVLVTVAPEIVSCEQIETLVKAGVIVSLGHSAANYHQAMVAIAAGARGFTHLFNAMSGFHSRQPGMVGAALNSKQSYYGLILDGLHVHPAAAQVAMRANPNMILVTDAMPTVGGRSNQFEFFGETICLQNQQLTNQQGQLAGAHLTMIDAVKNATSLLELELGDALRLASINPARFLNLQDSMGSIRVGSEANLLLLNDQMQVEKSWISGELIYQR